MPGVYEPGDYGRTLVLAEAGDAERIEAPLKDGVLTVGLPTAERARPQGKRIQVRGGRTATGAGRPAREALGFVTARRW